MTVQEQIEALKEKGARLRALLDDPHPGLASWTMAVGAVLDEIAAMAPTVTPKREKRFKCIKSLFKSTYGRNAFIAGKWYDTMTEDEQFVYLRDATGAMFNFAREHTEEGFYVLSDYFEVA